MISIDGVPGVARTAWLLLRDELVAILGDELVAVWAFGGTASARESDPFGDLDTFVVVRGPIDAGRVQAVDEALQAIERELGVEWDLWFVLDEEARRPGLLRHAWRDRINETSAIDRSHWLGGRYILLYGAEPTEIVTSPTAAEVTAALNAEVEHLERHVEAGDTDPYEATYAFLNGSRIVRALETGDVVISKREAGPWGLEHLPHRWHPALEAALRAYERQSSPEDEALLASEMAPFVAMVRERLSRSSSR